MMVWKSRLVHILILVSIALAPVTTTILFLKICWPSIVTVIIMRVHCRVFLLSWFLLVVTFAHHLFFQEDHSFELEDDRPTIMDLDHQTAHHSGKRKEKQDEVGVQCLEKWRDFWKRTHRSIFCDRKWCPWMENLLLSVVPSVPQTPRKPCLTQIWTPRKRIRLVLTNRIRRVRISCCINSD